MLFLTITDYLFIFCFFILLCIIIFNFGSLDMDKATAATEFLCGPVMVTGRVATVTVWNF